MLYTPNSPFLHALYLYMLDILLLDAIRTFYFPFSQSPVLLQDYLSYLEIPRVPSFVVSM
jgi:hypothetical protein